ncbi:MAG: hypothetical protein M1826_007010 [Phylliscum demangeonii]|nr:MAG: hypothetical protein M1826_007010 [Phylliscum demangeonii]
MHLSVLIVAAMLSPALAAPLPSLEQQQAKHLTRRFDLASMIQPFAQSLVQKIPEYVEARQVENDQKKALKKAQKLYLAQKQKADDVARQEARAQQAQEQATSGGNALNAQSRQALSATEQQAAAEQGITPGQSQYQDPTYDPNYPTAGLGDGTESTKFHTFANTASSEALSSIAQSQAEQTGNLAGAGGAGDGRAPGNQPMTGSGGDGSDGVYHPPPMTGKLPGYVAPAQQSANTPSSSAAGMSGAGAGAGGAGGAGAGLGGNFSQGLGAGAGAGMSGAGGAGTGAGGV